MTDKSLYQIALTQIKGVGVTLAHNLMKVMGDEMAVFKGNISKLNTIPLISKRLISEIRSPEVIRKAEEELEFTIKNNIQIHFFTEDNYPNRLKNCIDAPILLYSKGNTDFNQKKTISIIGTRNSTRYGQDICKEFVKEVAEKLPEIQIISGLAYGIDICAHRASLTEDLSTVAVLAHGLDRIYPHVHRQTAIDMMQKGALLTEFPVNTNPERHNFVRRNRIVAGMSDAVIVIESPTKGGSLITADIANSYYKEVFALPGRIHDKMSEGCNKLISGNKAYLLQSTEDFIKHMGWDDEVTANKNTPVQKDLFQDLKPVEENIYDIIKSKGPMQVNALSIESDTPLTELFMTLLELEMKNLIQSLPGGVYQSV